MEERSFDFSERFTWLVDQEGRDVALNIENSMDLENDYMLKKMLKGNDLVEIYEIEEIQGI